MKIDGYTLPRPSPGWSVPRLEPRTVVDEVQGGSVVHVGAGAYADNVVELQWDLPVNPTQATLQSQVHDGAHLSTAGLNAVAFEVTVSSFAAISLAMIQIDRVGTPVGPISVEVWNDSASAPGTKVGTLGGILCSALTAGPADYYFWPEGLAWPLTANGWIVINLSDLTTNTGGNRIDLPMGGGISAHYLYRSGGTWSAPELTRPTHAVYQASGEDAAPLLGLAEAFCYSGGSGPVLRTLTLDDGRRFSCYLVQGGVEWRVKPVAYTDKGFVSLKLGLVITASLDDRDLP